METTISRGTTLTSAEVAIKAAQVDAFRAEGYKAFKACEKVGLSRITYFKFKQREKRHELDKEKGEPPAKDSRPTTKPTGDKCDHGAF